MSDARELPPEVEAGFARLDEIANDPEKRAAFKAKAFAKAKAETPHLTDAQLEAQWTIAAALLLD